MVWIAIADHTDVQFDIQGLGPQGARAQAHSEVKPPDLLVPKGSLVVEIALNAHTRPQSLLTFNAGSVGGLQISLQALPGDGLTFVIANGQDLHHCTISHTYTGRTDVARITYTWDAPARIGMIASERTGSPDIEYYPVTAPKPIFMRDLCALCMGEGRQDLAEDVVYLAAATHITHIGPAPTLAADTPIATPLGYKAVGTLQRGDTVFAMSGDVVPVLHCIDCVLPARGLNKPTVLHAPYFGLKQTITVAPDQHLILRGSEVEYLFGHEAVLVPARHLVGRSGDMAQRTAGTIRYCQLLLPGNEALDAAGTAVESLNIGTIRRKPDVLAASLLAGLDRTFLPDHGRPLYPVLRAFDAQVLADYRAA